MSNRCYICEGLFAPRSEGPRHPARKTRDHVLPKCWGGTDLLHGDTKNTKDACSRCNGLRAKAGHCVGALAAARAVCFSTAQSEESVLHTWEHRKRVNGSPGKRKGLVDPAVWMKVLGVRIRVLNEA